MTEKILIIDFGSQYTQLIARRVRELNVYCEIHPYNHLPALDSSVRGVIMSGSPFSVRDAAAPRIDLTPVKGRLPLLGVCYGAQYLAHFFGGEVSPAPSREYGRAMLAVKRADDPLMNGMPSPTQVWMSHGDTITRVPAGYEVIASTDDVEMAAYRIAGEQTWGIQFHPEVFHSTDGKQLLRNFVVDICGCSQSWTSESFVESTVAELRAKLGDDKVVLGLSGGVDSSVAAVLLHKAIGERLYCIFVDSGLLRRNEFEDVLESYKGMGLNVKGVRAADRFLGDLKGVTDPEQKRKIIGRDFVEVFNEEAQRIEDVKWLAQGTIYPDVVESASVNGPAAKIKSHHNVGGLPEHMNLKIVEPLRLLFKDEVRRVGRSLGISEQLIGLIINVDGGATTAEVVKVAKEFIFALNPFCLILALQYCTNCTLRGAGDVLVPFLNLITAMVIRTMLAYILFWSTGQYIFAFYAFPFSWFISGIWAFVRFLRGKWQDKHLLEKIQTGGQNETVCGNKF